MYIIKKQIETDQSTNEKSLREMLNELITENEVAVSSIAEEIGINKDSFAEYLKGGYDLKLSQAIKLMKLLGLTESQLISAYNHEIAEKIYVSVHTVKAHVSSIIKKLNAKNRTDAACIAIREGICE